MCASVVSIPITHCVMFTSFVTYATHCITAVTYVYWFVEQEINKSTAIQFVILFRDAGMQYRALYAYNPDDEVANEVMVTKIHGTGPKHLSSKSMEKFYKYVAFCFVLFSAACTCLLMPGKFHACSELLLDLCLDLT